MENLSEALLPEASKWAQFDLVIHTGTYPNGQRLSGEEIRVFKKSQEALHRRIIETCEAKHEDPGLVFEHAQRIKRELESREKTSVS